MNDFLSISFQISIVVAQRCLQAVDSIWCEGIVDQCRGTGRQHLRKDREAPMFPFNAAGRSEKTLCIVSESDYLALILARLTVNNCLPELIEREVCPFRL